MNVTYFKKTAGLVVLLILVGSAFQMPEMAFAGQGVTVSVTTDKDVYVRSSLSTTLIVVSLYVENNTDEWLVLTEDYRKLNTYAQFGNIWMEPAKKVGQSSPCGTCTAVKGLAFKPTTLPAYQNVATENSANFFTKNVSGTNVSVLGIYIGPHERKMVARAEVYLNEFLTSPIAGQYKVRASIYPRSIWNWLTQAEAASQTGTGYEAVSFIRLK